MSTHAAAGVSQAAVQAAINSAVDGDTVTVPSGSATWSGTVTVGKGIILQGAGIGQTIITNPNAQNQGSCSLDITLGTVAKFKLTGFDFRGQNSFNLSGTPTTQPFLIRDCNFDDAQNNSVFGYFNGNCYGVVSGCAFSSGASSEMLHNMGYGASSDAGWKDDCVPGSINMVYIEACTFSKNPYVDDYFWGTAAMEAYYGARTVMRHCTLNYCDVDQHGTAGNIGTRWWEFYENTFTLPSYGLTGLPNQSSYTVCRGGSGVIFNNHVTGGPNSGGGGIAFYEEDTGTYPVLYQVGRGINETTSPAYVWGNDAAMTPGADGNLVQIGRDVMVSSTQPATMKRSQLSTDTPATTYSYTPLIYPHPLITADNSSGGGSVPAFDPAMTINTLINQLIDLDSQHTTELTTTTDVRYYENVMQINWAGGSRIEIRVKPMSRTPNGVRLKAVLPKVGP